MVVNLNPADNEKLVNLLATKPFVSNPTRLKLVLFNSDLGNFAHELNFTQPPKDLIFNIISDLSSMGQDESGREALGRFLNTLIDENGNFVSDQQEKQYIKSIIEKYKMMPSITNTQNSFDSDVILIKQFLDKSERFLTGQLENSTYRGIWQDPDLKPNLSQILNFFYNKITRYHPSKKEISDLISDIKFDLDALDDEMPNSGAERRIKHKLDQRYRRAIEIIDKLYNTKGT